MHTTQTYYNPNSYDSNNRKGWGNVITLLLCVGLPKRLRRSIQWAWKDNVTRTCLSGIHQHNESNWPSPRSLALQNKEEDYNNTLVHRSVRTVRSVDDSTAKASDVPARHCDRPGQLSLTKPAQWQMHRSPWRGTSVFGRRDAIRK